MDRPRFIDPEYPLITIYEARHTNRWNASYTHNNICRVPQVIKITSALDCTMVST